MPRYNGTSRIIKIDWEEVDTNFSCDCSLQRAAGWAGGPYFTTEFPEHIEKRNLHINQLEAITLVVATKLWAHQCETKRVLVHCDNLSTV